MSAEDLALKNANDHSSDDGVSRNAVPILSGTRTCNNHNKRDSNIVLDSEPSTTLSKDVTSNSLQDKADEDAGDHIQVDYEELDDDTLENAMDDFFAQNGDAMDISGPDGDDLWNDLFGDSEDTMAMGEESSGNSCLNKGLQYDNGDGPDVMSNRSTSTDITSIPSPNALHLPGQASRATGNIRNALTTTKPDSLDPMTSITQTSTSSQKTLTMPSPISSAASSNNNMHAVSSERPQNPDQSYTLSQGTASGVNISPWAFGRDELLDLTKDVSPRRKGVKKRQGSLASIHGSAKPNVKRQLQNRSKSRFSESIVDILTQPFEAPIQGGSNIHQDNHYKNSDHNQEKLDTVSILDNPMLIFPMMDKERQNNPNYLREHIQEVKDGVKKVWIEAFKLREQNNQHIKDKEALMARINALLQATETDHEPGFHSTLRLLADKAEELARSEHESKLLRKYSMENASDREREMIIGCKHVMDKSKVEINESKADVTRLQKATRYMESELKRANAKLHKQNKYIETIREQLLSTNKEMAQREKVMLEVDKTLHIQAKLISAFGVSNSKKEATDARTCNMWHHEHLQRSFISLYEENEMLKNMNQQLRIFKPIQNSSSDPSLSSSSQRISSLENVYEASVASQNSCLQTNRTFQGSSDKAPYHSNAVTPVTQGFVPHHLVRSTIQPTSSVFVETHRDTSSLNHELINTRNATIDSAYPACSEREPTIASAACDYTNTQPGTMSPDVAISLSKEQADFNVRSQSLASMDPTSSEILLPVAKKHDSELADVALSAKRIRVSTD